MDQEMSGVSRVQGSRAARGSQRGVVSVLALALASGPLAGCAVVAVADAAVTVVATGVKVGADVVGVAADAASAGVHAVVGTAKK